MRRGTTRQPIIAIRRYGRGEVIISDSTRLAAAAQIRRGLLRQLWGQMIHRLGLSHALGSQSDSSLRTDASSISPTTKCWSRSRPINANYEPLAADDLPEHCTDGRVDHTRRDRRKATDSAVCIPLFREGFSKTRLSAVVPGEHRVTVTDPVDS